MFAVSVTRWPQIWTSLWILWQLVLLVLETFIKSQELTLLTCHEVAELFKWTRPWLAWRNLWQASIWTFEIIWNKFYKLHIDCKITVNSELLQSKVSRRLYTRQRCMIVNDMRYRLYIHTEIQSFEVTFFHYITFLLDFKKSICVTVEFYHLYAKLLT